MRDLFKSNVVATHTCICYSVYGVQLNNKMLSFGIHSGYAATCSDIAEKKFLQ